jgi:hypothetical protein
MLYRPIMPMVCSSTQGAYTEYPLVQIGEGYGAEDLEPDNDPGGILRDTVLKEKSIALQNRNTAGCNKLAMYALMWDTISRESQEAVMQRTSEQPEDGENAGDHEALQMRTDPLLLRTYVPVLYPSHPCNRSTVV